MREDVKKGGKEGKEKKLTFYKVQRFLSLGMQFFYCCVSFFPHSGSTHTHTNTTCSEGLFSRGEKPEESDLFFFSNILILNSTPSEL